MSLLDEMMRERLPQAKEPEFTLEPTPKKMTMLDEMLAERQPKPPIQDLSQTPSPLDTSVTGVMSDMGGDVPPMNQPQEPQAPQFGEYKWQSDLPTSTWENIKMGFWETLQSPDRKEKLIEYLGDSFLGEGKDNQGNETIRYKNVDGEEREVYVDAPVEDFASLASQSLDVAGEMAVFALGTKTLGGLGGLAGLSGPTSALGKIGVEGLKSGMVEAGRTLASTESSDRAVKDAGIETVMSIMTDSAFRYLPKGVSTLLNKLPLVGDVTSKIQGKAGQLMYGGDKDLATALAFTDREDIAKESLEKVTAKPKKGESFYEWGSRQTDKIDSKDEIIKSIFKDAPIADAEKKLLLKNIYSKRSEDYIARTLHNDISQFENDLLLEFRDQVDPVIFARLDQNPELKEKYIQTMLSTLPDNEFKSNYLFLLNSKKSLSDYRKGNWVEGQPKPSDIISGLGGEFLSNPDPIRNIKIRADINASKAETIEDYIKLYNDTLKKEKVKRLADKPELLNSDRLQPIDLTKIFNPKDEKTKSLLNMLSQLKYYGTGISSVGQLTAGADLGSTLTTGAMAFAGGALIENMVKKQPKMFIEALKNISQSQSSVVKSMTKQELDTLKRFKTTGEVKDFTRYLMQSYRRQSDLKESLRQKGETSTIQEPEVGENIPPMENNEEIPLPRKEVTDFDATKEIFQFEAPEAFKKKYDVDLREYLVLKNEVSQAKTPSDKKRYQDLLTKKKNKLNFLIKLYNKGKTDKDLI